MPGDGRKSYLLKAEVTVTAAVTGELEWQRRLCAIRLLEEYNTAASRDLLQALAKGEANAASTREAEASLQRMQQLTDARKDAPR
jgi:hypothetical protein